MDLEQRYNEWKPIQATMRNFYIQLLRQGIHAKFGQAPEMALMMHINIGKEQGETVMASFLVQWNEDEQDWSVHRLSFQRVRGGLQQVKPPVERFTTLPDLRWFISALQAWLDHEQREGLFAPPKPE